MIALTDYVPAQVTQCTRQAIAQAPLNVVPEALVYAILAKEGGRPGQISAPNRNGTVDVGRAQVNSANSGWLRAQGFDWKAVLHDECTNIKAGLTILHHFYVSVGYDWPKAIRAYNAGLKPKGAVGYKYMTDVVSYWRWFESVVSVALTVPETVAETGSALVGGNRVPLGIPGFGPSGQGGY